MTEAPQGSQDGLAYLTFFSSVYNISFVWSGKPGEPIEVCPGGYGEPVVEKIDTPYTLKHQSFPLTYWLGWFHGECLKWLSHNLEGFSEAELHAMIDRTQEEDDER